MYWTRADSVWGFVPWLLMSALWWAGGVLIVTYLFRLPPRERVIAGLGTGLLLYLSLSNLASYLGSLPVALWAGAILVLVLGLVAAWKPGLVPLLSGFPGLIARLRTLRDAHPQMNLAFLGNALIHSPWLLLIALGGLIYFFESINRGLAIFDDYHNLPLVSTMAAGDVPPHFYLNTGELFAYHYGWHLFAASLVRIGDLFPWSAFDFSKAISMALMVCLAWLWFWRWMRSRLGAFLGALLVLLGGGARWLLLFVPVERLNNISATITLQGSSAYSGPDLYTNLSGPWLIEGDGPLPFPFAFANGIFPPGVMALGGSGAIPLATFFLLLLLARRDWTMGSAAIYSLLLATLGLTAEYMFAPLVVGLGLALLSGYAFQGWRNRKRLRSSAEIQETPGRQRRMPFEPSIAWWAGILFVSVVVAFASGGLLTEMLRRFLDGFTGGTAATGAGFLGFWLRWPPALVSAHLGELTFSTPGHILVGLAEVGPVLLLAPLATWWAWKAWKRGDWLLAGVGLAALVGFLAPMFVEYMGRDRDITHMTGTALFFWLVLAYPLALRQVCRKARWQAVLWPTVFAAAAFGGLVLLAIQLLAIPRPQLTTFVNDERDASLSSQYWNRLEPEASILDPIPHRAITLFGLGGGRAYLDFFMPLPEWQALLDDPDPVRIASAGYSYMYIDQEWWSYLTREERDRFKHPCVQQVNTNAGKGVGMRRLLDIRACKESEVKESSQ